MKDEQQLVTTEHGSADLMTIIQRVVEGPLNLEKVEVLERLLAMQERVMADQRKQSFDAAMSRLQAVLPQMDKHGQAKNSKYAKLEDIDVVIRPLLAAEDFSISFNEESHTDKTTTFIMSISRQGHTESRRLTVPIDVAAKNREGNAIRPAIQDSGSTVSYARRYLIKMLLNIVEQGEDTNGEKRKAISEEQEKQLRDQVEDAGMNLDKFLVYMRVAKLSEIMVADWDKAQTVIRAAIADKKK